MPPINDCLSDNLYKDNNYFQIVINNDVIFTNYRTKSRPNFDKQAPPFDKGRGQRGGNVNIGAAKAASSSQCPTIVRGAYPSGLAL